MKNMFEYGKVRFEVKEPQVGCLRSVQLVLQVLEELLHTMMPVPNDVCSPDGFGLLDDSLPDEVKRLLASAIIHGVELSSFEMCE